MLSRGNIMTCTSQPGKNGAFSTETTSTNMTHTEQRLIWTTTYWCMFHHFVLIVEFSQRTSRSLVLIYSCKPLPAPLRVTLTCQLRWSRVLYKWLQYWATSYPSSFHVAWEQTLRLADVMWSSWPLPFLLGQVGGHTSSVLQDCYFTVVCSLYIRCWQNLSILSIRLLLLHRRVWWW